MGTYVNDGAVSALGANEGFEVSVGPSVVVIDEGMGKTLTTTTAKYDIYAFLFGQKGLMACVGLQGNQITRLRGETLATEEQKDLLKLRARLAVAEGASEEEVKVLTEIVALDPLDGEALILLGQQAGRTGNPEQAVFYYERAASLEKFEADAKVRHAQLLVGQGKYQEALPLLRRAQTIKPRDNIQQYLEQIERVAQGK